MLCIKNIDLVELDRDEVMIYKYEHHALDLYLPSATDEDDPISMAVATEIIRGRDFVFRGERYCLGMSEQVQKAIGLPMECFDKMEKDLAIADQRTRNLEYQTGELSKQLGEYKTMGFWRRFKALFTGY